MNPAVADLAPLERRTLGDSIYGHLSGLLTSGRLAPGERLSLRDSAAALGVSVMPVREAVSRLVADGALEVAPNRAVRVPVMTTEGFRELADTRMAIEGLAAARAARCRTPRQMAAIRRAEAAFRALIDQDSPDPGLSVALNRDLHFSIYDACGLPTLRNVIVGLWLKAGPVINLDLRAGPDRLKLGHARRCHAEALAAIIAGDAAAAEAAIAGDIDEAARFIIARGVLPASA
ncbi:GntR family transcriptional regulator [Roseomonas marmotae]|uniref:GntR family transcriptional regulator n=1 Tax=Roseomonas marmotae TaxID=2768161 RepID=A0ABS3KC28_9PROT|nr:GntR family transcriptional regulator [Roseomonas marmotae]MBO1075029.1 GntR family transcriptional regulator [Roseomonas marmotae]QTI79936.1 GntR family transcriptional regulator [Roseomonas marmotae]